MSNIPKYEALAQELKSEIENGIYPVGGKLPIEMELVAKYKVSRHTVRQALAKLENMGLIESRQGSGTFVKNNDDIRQPSKLIVVMLRYIDEHIFIPILRGIEEELSKKGYSILISPTKNRIDEERKVLVECMTRQVDGIIAEGVRSARLNPNLDLYKQLSDRKIPIVFIDSYYDGMSEQICVGMDDYAGSKQLVDYLYQKGKRKITGVFKEETKAGQQRYLGFAQSLIKYGILPKDENIIWYDTENASDLFSEKIITRLDEYDAIICYNDDIAFKLIESLKKYGKDVPKDVAVVSFDNSIYSEMSSVKITSLNHPKEKMGEIAAKKLINMIEGKLEESIILPWQLIEKESS